jgi:hypothetical protein
LSPERARDPTKSPLNDSRDISYNFSGIVVPPPPPLGKTIPNFAQERKTDRQTDRRQEATEVLDSAAVTGFSSISFFSQEDQQQQQPPPWFLKTSIFCKFYTNKTKHRLLLLLQATNR